MSARKTVARTAIATLRLQPKVLKELDKIAKSEDVSRSALMEMIVVTWMQERAAA